MEGDSSSSIWKKIFLILNCILLATGNCSGPLITRLYYINGGTRVWLPSFLLTAGFPLSFILLTISYIRRCYHSRRSTVARVKVCFMKPGIFLASSIIGTLTGIDLYMYSGGLSRLSASTASLIFPTQLAFTATFSFLLVKQKFTEYSINAVVLLTAGAVVLGLGASGDRPVGESVKNYTLGFCFMVAAAALAGFVVPAQEMIYRKAEQAVTYSLALEIQTTICAFASAVSIVGMLITGDFQEISSETKPFELGESGYYLVLFGICILMQFAFIGCAGVLLYDSSLLCGIIITAALPMAELLAIVFYHEQFQAEKGIALFLCVWV